MGTGSAACWVLGGAPVAVGHLLAAPASCPAPSARHCVCRWGTLRKGSGRQRPVSCSSVLVPRPLGPRGRHGSVWEGEGVSNGSLMPHHRPAGPHGSRPGCTLMGTPAESGQQPRQRQRQEYLRCSEIIWGTSFKEAHARALKWNFYGLCAMAAQRFVWAELGCVCRAPLFPGASPPRAG